MRGLKVKIRKLLSGRDSSIKEGNYKFIKDARPPPSKQKKIPIVADLMPIRNKIDALSFTLEFSNILMKPIIHFRCGCVGYFYKNYGVTTFKYIGMCTIHEIRELLTNHRASYKSSEWYRD